MPLDPARRAPLMCLTQDGTGLAHSEQARRLCAGGARFIQLRMKGAARDHWLEEARLAAGICRAHGALLVVNDSVEIALESGAHGVHLGARDGDWREARRWLGPALLVGGTVNVLADARRAASSGSLDYVGVGPLRYTATKRDLSPVLGIAGAARLIAALEGLPAWVIGGVAPADLPALHGAGAAGVAVSSYLYREGRIEENLRALAEAWPATDPAPIS